jgi:hypothetical protein
MIKEIAKKETHQVTIRNVDHDLYVQLATRVAVLRQKQHEVTLAILQREFSPEREENLISVLPEELRTIIAAYAKERGKSILDQIIEDLGDAYL